MAFIDPKHFSYGFQVLPYVADIAQDVAQVNKTVALTTDNTA